MTMIQSIGAASDHVLATLISGLEIEFGRGAGKALARRFLDAEEVDFRWHARIIERWLGVFQDTDDEDLELDLVAICGLLDGEWFAATMIVDGDGETHGMLGCRSFASEGAARKALAEAH